LELEKKKNSFKLNTKIVLNSLMLLLVFGGGFVLGDKNEELYQQIKYGNVTNNSGLPNQLNYEGVEELYSHLKNSYDGNLEADKLEDGLKEGLVKAAGDPFTEYLNADDTADFEDDLNGSFEGIGAELGKEDQSIVIISPIEGFPAKEAGLKAGDIIAEIDGEPAFDLTISEAVKEIRGPEGTKVKLGIVRDGKTLEIEITRAKISVPSVTSEIAEGNVGIIEISRFGNDTTSLVRSEANKLQSQGARAFVLDLRGNPGGLLDSAVDVASLWLPKGTKILEEKRGEEIVKTYGARGDAMLQGVPTVVLINEGSASASEIVAGALRDNDAATIIGQKSYGKGSVQEVINLGSGGSLKVTIARWFTPSGRNIDKEGIKPDKEVKAAENRSGKDPQLEEALRRLR
jgi:carboxyl-terminal processing protease